MNFRNLLLTRKISEVLLAEWLEQDPGIPVRRGVEDHDAEGPGH